MLSCDPHMRALVKSAMVGGTASCLAAGAAILIMTVRTGRYADLNVLLGGVAYAGIFLIGPFIASRKGWLEPRMGALRYFLAALPIVFLPATFFVGFIGWGDIQEHWIRAGLHLVHREIPTEQVGVLVLSAAVAVGAVLAGALIWISVSTLTRTWRGRSFLLYCLTSFLLMSAFWRLTSLISISGVGELILPLAGYFLVGALFAIAAHWNSMHESLVKPLLLATTCLAVLVVGQGIVIAAKSVPETTFPDTKGPPLWTIDVGQAGCPPSYGEPNSSSAPLEITFASQETIGMAIPAEAVPLGGNKWKYSSCLLSIDSRTGKRIAQTMASIYQPSIRGTPEGDFSVSGIEGSGGFTIDLQQKENHAAKSAQVNGPRSHSVPLRPELSYFKGSSAGQLWFEKDGARKLLVPRRCGDARPQLVADDRVLVICANSFYVFATEGDLVASQVIVRPGVHFAAVSKDKRRFALSIYIWGFGDPSYLEEETIVVYDSETVRPIFSVKSNPLPEQQSWAALSPDGSLLAVGAKRTLKLFRLPSDEAHQIKSADVAPSSSSASGGTSCAFHRNYISPSPLAFPALFLKNSAARPMLSLACDAKMHHMKKATVRDLRYRFSVVEDLLREGEEIHITKRKRVIARLLPPKPVTPVDRPDFMARLKKIYGKKRMKVSGAEIIALDREERF